MITTPSAGGRPAPVAAPIHQIAEEAAIRRALILAAQKQETEAEPDARATGSETARAIAPTPLAEAPRRYIADREQAMRDKMSAEAAAAAQPQAMAPEDAPVEMTVNMPPPPTESAVKGGRQSRTDARAEMYEAEARLRVLNRASTGYAFSRSVIG